MRFLRLLVTETRMLARKRLPASGARLAVAIGAAAWIVFGSYSVMQIAQERAPRPEGVITIIVLFLGTALAVSVSAAARYLERPEQTHLWRLAPVPPTYAVLVPFTAVTLIASLATLIIGAPLLTLGASLGLAQVALLLALAAVLVMWASIAAIAVLASMSLRRGTDAAAALGRTAVTPLMLVTMVLMRWSASLARQIDVAGVVILLLVSAALLPFALRAVAPLWLQALGVATTARRSLPARWGSPMWWRMLRRSPLPWAAIGLVPAVIASGSARHRTVAMALVGLPMATMFQLVRWEDDCPDRQRLAPAAGALRTHLWFRVGLPAAVVATLVAFVTGNQRSAPFAALVAAIWTGPLLYFITATPVRNGLQIALLVAASVIAFSL